MWTTINRARDTLYRLSPALLERAKNQLLDNIKSQPDLLRDAPDIIRGDRKFILKLLEREPSAMRHIPEHLKRNKGFVMKAIRRNVDVYDELDNDMKDNKEVLLTAVRLDGRALLSANDAFKCDREVVKTAVMSNGSGLLDACQQLKNDRELAFEAVKRWPSQIAHVSPRLKRDMELAHLAVEKDGFSLGYLPSRLRRDPSLVQEAVRSDGLALAYVGPMFKRDQALILTAVENNPDAIESVSKTVMRDPGFQKAVALLSVPALETIRSTLGLEISDEARNAQAAMLDAFKLLDIESPHRFKRSAEIIRNRYEIAPEPIKQALEDRLGKEYFLTKTGRQDKPLAVVVLAKEDHNNALANTSIDDISRRYEVLYFEAGTDTKLIDAIRQAPHSSERKIAVMMIGGHGSRGKTFLGDPYNTSPEDAAYLDPSDRDKLASLRDTVACGAKIILASCSGGRESDFSGSGVDSIAELIHQTWPQAELFSTTAVTGIRVDFDPMGKVNGLSAISFGQVIRNFDTLVLHVPAERRGCDTAPTDGSN